MKDATTNNTGIDNKTIENTLARFEWDWVRNSEGWTVVHMTADEEHGDIATEYWFRVSTDDNNLLVLRLYATKWFLGRPDQLDEICHEWNSHTTLPKVAVLVDNEGDTRFVLEWGVRCYDDQLRQELIDCWIDEFTALCSHFLARYAETICALPRYASTVH